MRLAIALAEKIYKELMRDRDLPNRLSIERAITNGTPLPSGLGRLFNADALSGEVYETSEWNGDIHKVLSALSIETVPTIIEADKEARYGILGERI